MTAALALLPVFTSLASAAPIRRSESALVKRIGDTFPESWADLESKCDALTLNLGSFVPHRWVYNIATS